MNPSIQDPIPALQFLARILIHILVRIDVQGLDNLPRKGPAIIAPDHVSSFDLPIIFAYANSSVVTFTAEKWKSIFFQMAAPHLRACDLHPAR